MELLNNSAYKNVTNKDTALDDELHQPESGMASPTIGEAIPIYEQISTKIFPAFTHQFVTCIHD